MLKIYIRPGCPYCDKVMREAGRLGLREGEQYKLIDAGPGTTGRQELLEIGGKPMVPFIRSGALAMYESDDIIAYLKKEFNTE